MCGVNLNKHLKGSASSKSLQELVTLFENVISRACVSSDAHEFCASWCDELASSDLASSHCFSQYTVLNPCHWLLIPIKANWWYISSCASFIKSKVFMHLCNLSCFRLVLDDKACWRAAGVDSSIVVHSSLRAMLFPSCFSSMCMHLLIRT